MPPRQIRGSRSIIEEQQKTIRKQDIAIAELRSKNENLKRILASVLDDYKNHACVTDKTLRIVKSKIEELE